LSSEGASSEGASSEGASSASPPRGDEPLLDAMIAPSAVAAAIARGQRVLLRVAPPCPDATEPGHGPVPGAAAVLVLDPDAAPSLATGTLDAPAARALRVNALVLEKRALAWGGWGGAAFDRGSARLALAEDDGTRWIVADAFHVDETAARDELAPLAQVLAARLDVPTPPELDDVDTTSTAAALAALPLELAVRFAVRDEHDYLVLRDHAGQAPSDRAARYGALSAIALGLGAVACAAFVGELRAGESVGTLVIDGVIGAVLLLASFAMGMIAWHASRYRAASVPVAWLHDDRVVVAPWVSRAGAIARVPEGRFGAAIKIAEIDCVEIRRRGDEHAVTLDGPHGPIDVLTTPHAAVASHWRDALERLLRRVAAPSRKPILRGRAA
jgi:hypothetical protein